MNNKVSSEVQNFVNNIFNEYKEKDTWEVKENSNVSFCFGGLNKHVISKATKIFWKGIYDKIDTRIMEGHDNGDYHIHDLNSYSSYCFGASLEDILKKGIRGLKNVAISAPPKHLSSLTAQIANIATIYQNEVAGKLCPL